jgi:MFS family permease
MDNSARALDPVYRKVVWHLIPYIFVCYFFNYLDRVNVGFAKLQMLDDLHLSESAYGLGAGIFFVGYILFGVPSNLMLAKVGARRWLALIMVLWGAFSASLLLVRDAHTFYVIRFLTGATEAGFFPGIVLYLTRWFPSARRGRIMAQFMAAIPLSGVIGGPLSGWMLVHFGGGQANMAAWQWLFLLQGVPTIVLGLGVLMALSNGVETASWLSDAERQTLRDELEADRRATPTTAADSFAKVIANPAIWLLGVIYFCVQSGVYAINFWLPSIIKASVGQDPAVIGWLSAIPYLAASIFMVLVGRSADARAERRWHLAVPLLMGAGGLIIAAAFAANIVVAMIGLTFATMGALTGLPMLWPLSSRYLTAAAAAGGLALINSTGQIAGFVSPYFVGWVKDAAHSTNPALYSLAGVMVFGALLTLSIRAKARDTAAPAR